MFSLSEVLGVLLSTRSSGPFLVKCRRAPSRPLVKVGPKAQRLTDTAQGDSPASGSVAGLCRCSLDADNAYPGWPHPLEDGGARLGRRGGGRGGVPRRAGRPGGQVRGQAAAAGHAGPGAAAAGGAARRPAPPGPGWVPKHPPWPSVHVLYSECEPCVRSLFAACEGVPV